MNKGKIKFLHITRGITEQTYCQNTKIGSVSAYVHIRTRTCPFPLYAAVRILDDHLLLHSLMYLMDSPLGYYGQVR